METLILEPSFNTVKTIPILKMMEINIFARYYDDNYPSVKEQKAYEKNIFNKTCKTDSEIVPLEGLTMAHKSSMDLYFYVIGRLLQHSYNILNCLFNSWSHMVRENIEKQALLENREGLFLATDESIDGGMILECNRQQVAPWMALRGEDVLLTEEAVSQVLQRTDQAVTPSVKIPLFLAPHAFQKIHVSGVTSQSVSQMILLGTIRNP